MLNDNAPRFLAADMVEQAHSGHPGMPMGMATVASVLYEKFLHFYAPDPWWPNRDRFILSGGHGSALLYALLYLTGTGNITLDDLKNFRQLGAKTAGHPEYGLLEGVEVSTGPLGQGLANAVGMALAERLLAARFGDRLINHRTYVIIGDGDLMEGISEEVLSLAGLWRLNHLTALWDDNKITIDGTTDKSTATDVVARFRANGWDVVACDAYNRAEIEQALTMAQQNDKPTLVVCHSVIGYGSPKKAGTLSVHGAPLGAEELQAAKENLGWTYEPFTVPDDILKSWRTTGRQAEGAYQQWQDTYQHLPQKEKFDAFMTGRIPTNLQETLKNWLRDFMAQHPEPLATRKAGALVLEQVAQHLPQLITGSADLSGSCYTHPSAHKDITANNFVGSYLNYGVREHGMTAIMNGLAAHKGFIPLSSTFFSFVDYMKPAVRMAALMRLKVLYVLTHDSIGVGEDGPTHQPIEHLLSLRAVPNLLVFRPCDIVEMTESYLTALSYQGPSAFVLSRQNLPLVRTDISENKTAHGGYVLRDTPRRDLTLIATGSEVALALQVAQLYQERNIHVAVVSMPCTSLFDEQEVTYQKAVLGSAPCVALEMASSLGWYKYTGTNGLVIGIDTFGASGKAKDLLDKYGFTPTAVIEKINAHFGF